MKAEPGRCLRRCSKGFNPIEDVGGDRKNPNEKQNGQRPSEQFNFPLGHPRFFCFPAHANWNRPSVDLVVPRLPWRFRCFQPSRSFRDSHLVAQGLVFRNIFRLEIAWARWRWQEGRLPRLAG